MLIRILIIENQALRRKQRSTYWALGLLTRWFDPSVFPADGDHASRVIY